MRNIPAVLIAALILSVPFAALADGDSYNSDQAAVVDESRLQKPGKAIGDTTTGRDPRLPPVLPGETVNRNGRQMKVWTTAGPVPLGAEPEPWSKNRKTTAAEGKDISVIIDKRHGIDHAPDATNAEPNSPVETEGQIDMENER